MSFSKDKIAVDDDIASEAHMKYDSEKYHSNTPNADKSESLTATTEGEETPLTEQEAGDAALANAPWQYKLIALVTALLFPSKVSKIKLTFSEQND